MDVPTVEQPALAPEGGRSGRGAGARPAGWPAGGGRWSVLGGWAAEHPLLWWWGISLVLAVLSAIVWPTVPSYDPWSWIDWGRSVTDPHISFYVGDGPSWKPLPFLFTTIYGAIGGSSPTLWVITARTGGIAGLIGAARLAWLLCRRAGLPEWSGAVAGFVAPAGLVLAAPASPWTYYFFRGTSEPLLIGVWVWAIDCLIRRRHMQAFLLVAVEGLMRPEAWPFLLVYGAWLAWRQPSLRPWVLLAWLAQPVGWFGPPWISTGQPFLAATHASEYNGGLGTGMSRLTGVLSRGEAIQPLPSLALAIAALLLALWLGRARLPRLGARRVRGAPGVPAGGSSGRLRGSVVAVARWFETDGTEVPIVVGLAAATIGWWVIVVGMTEDGYPGLERFFLPAAAMICVLSGYGLAQVGAVAGRIVRALTGKQALTGAQALRLARVGTLTMVVVLAAVLAASTHFVSARWSYALKQEPRAATAVTRIHDLQVAVGKLGGRSALLPCPSSVVTVNHALQTALAWYLGTTLARVQTRLTRPGVAFSGPHDTIDGGFVPIAWAHQKRLLMTVGQWRIYQVWPVGQRLDACVGR